MFTETANRKYQLWFNSDVTPNRQYLQYKNDKGSLVHKQCKYVHISVQTADGRRWEKFFGYLPFAVNVHHAYYASRSNK